MAAPMPDGRWQEDKRFAKECGCIDHTVPCWLWMDRMARERVSDARAGMEKALAEYRAAPSFLAHDALLMHVAAVGAIDRPRIQGKLANMRRLGIDVIPPDLVAQVETEWSAPRASAAVVREEQQARQRTRAAKLRAASMAVEMAASPKEKRRLQAELAALTKGVP